MENNKNFNIDDDKVVSNTQKDSKTKKIVFSIITVVIILLAGFWYVNFKNNIPVTEKEPQGIEKYFAWEVKDEKLDERSINIFYERFQKAKALLEENSEDFNGWLMLGDSKLQVGDYEGARDAWEYLSSIRPKNSLSYGNLAALYTYNIYNPEKAEFNYLKAIENSEGEPFNINYYRNYAEFALYFVKDREKAKKILEEGIEKNDKNYYDLAVFLSDIYKEDGDIENAIKYIEKALVLKPESEILKKELENLKKQKN